jgi:hypothetical protein
MRGDEIAKQNCHMSDGFCNLVGVLEIIKIIIPRGKLAV